MCWFDATEFPEIRNFGAIGNMPRVGAQIPGFEHRLHDCFTFYIHINYSARGAGHLSICAKIDKKALHLMVVAT